MNKIKMTKFLCRKAYNVRAIIFKAEVAGQDVATHWATMQDADDLIDLLVEHGTDWEGFEEVAESADKHLTLIAVDLV